MKVLITAGGTTEPIDSVRSITNTSTGKLGSLIAEEFNRKPETEKIYYVCGKNAMVPNAGNTEIIHVSTVASLETAIRAILQEEVIDCIIHSMAVSDYRVEAVASISGITKYLNTEAELTGKTNSEITDAVLLKAIADAGRLLQTDGKIPSNMDNLVLTMKKNPKIISLYQTIAPKAILVGFKLLDHVSTELLIDTAYRILLDNKCQFVLANDLGNITASQHVGYLIREDKSYLRLTSKEEIARALVSAVFERRGER